TGGRWLVVPTQPVADFVASIYDFDRVVVTQLTVQADRRTLDVAAPDLELELHFEASRGWPIPAPRRRPRWLTRYVEAPIARRLLRGVEPYGVSPTGVREWYQATRYRPLTAARATRAGVDLGPVGPLVPPVRFGFSEPPRRPSLVEVTTRLKVPPPRRGPG
ncbi:MAG TPA: hypothetical protein VF244_09445, partial [Acidimicrobiales bacterium]